jgi:pimeloyl-ACP methyl ester carboxylesterase
MRLREADGVSDVPDTHYAKSGDAHIAYQVIGDGPIDLVLFGTFVSHVELNWEDPSISRFLRGLASFARVIVYDKRGVGMSDPAVTTPTLEERMEDVRAVMDAAGSERAALLGTSEGGSLAILFAATYPQRTLALILFSTFARIRRADDYPAGVQDRILEQVAAEVERDWGGDFVLDLVLPSVGNDQRAREWWRRYMRRSTSPGAAQAQLLMNYDIDVRHLLASVRAPTLVLHAALEQWIWAPHGQYLGEHIPGARYVEIDSADHLPFLECADTIIEESREFLTGVREPAEPDRVLATVLSATSPRPPSGPPSWATAAGASCSTRTTTPCVASSTGSEAGRSRPWATVSSPPSTDRPGRSEADGRSATPPEPSASTCESGSTRARSSCAASDIGGVGVHVAQRVCALARPGEVLVSEAVPLLVAGSGIGFEDRGAHQLKGIPDSCHLYAARV